MKTDVKEDETHYMMDVELPGVKKEDINVTLKDGYLTISAKREDKRDEKSKGKYVCHERTYGSASRSLPLEPVSAVDFSWTESSTKATKAKEPN